MRLNDVYIFLVYGLLFLNSPRQCPARLKKRKRRSPIRFCLPAVWSCPPAHALARWGAAPCRTCRCVRPRWTPSLLHHAFYENTQHEKKRNHARSRIQMSNELKSLEHMHLRTNAYSKHTYEHEQTNAVHIPTNISTSHARVMPSLALRSGKEQNQRMKHIKNL